jgi:predicted dinucleotide-binding enzyme
MKTAIIGVGHIGATLAKNLTTGGEHVILANQTLEKAVKLAAELGPNASALPMADAISSADVIIFAVYFDVIKELCATYRRELSGKIVIDPSNPIGPDGKGGFVKTIPPEQSSGELLAALLPGDTELVKAFGTLGAESLASAAHRQPEPAVLFYATDFPEAAKVAARLITASGFAPVAVGGINQSIRIEVGGALHEFGALGKLVSAKEAASLV